MKPYGVLTLAGNKRNVYPTLEAASRRFGLARTLRSNQSLCLRSEEAPPAMACQLFVWLEQLLVEVRVSPVASRVYEPEGVFTLLARPQVLVFMSQRMIGPSEHFMYVRIPACGTLLLRASRNVLWHGYFPFGPRGSTVSGMHLYVVAYI